MSKLAEYAEVLYDVLPCDTYQEILAGMLLTYPFFTLEMVNNTIHWVRTHPDEAGYNISYVKVGMPGVGEGRRFFVINKDDTTFRMSDEQIAHFDNGILMTVLGTDTRLKNQIEMLIAGQAHEARRVAREAYEDLQEELNGFVRKMRRVQRIIERKRNGTDGT